MRQFFLKLMIVCLTLFAADRGLGRLLAGAYHRITHGELGRSNWTMDSCRAQTVILGSSRAAHHYVPAIIGAGLSATCYNAGKDKQRLPYCLAVLTSLYARYSPETVILDLNPTAFNADENGMNELSTLLPYYQSHPEIRAIIDHRNRFEWVKAMSRLYCYNSLPLKILFNTVSAGREEGMDGYVALTTMKEPIPDTSPDLPAAFPPDAELENCFRRIVAMTQRHRTNLVVVISPLYYKLSENGNSIARAKRIAEENGVRLLDFSREFADTDNGRTAFVDLSHLNDSSARIFSANLVRQIRRVKR